MTAIDTLLTSFAEVASNPGAQLEKHLAAGKRVVGVGPYHVPEELVHAAGAVPFGVWGMVGPVVEAKKYFPSFYCSICQATLEMGLTHKLDKLSGMMITGLCDTLRAFSQNWKAGVGNRVPMIYVTNAQNRLLPAGRQYSIEAYKEVKRGVEECCDAIVSDSDLHASIVLYNEWRAAMRTFVQLAGTHPAQVGLRARIDVIDAGYYMDKADHLSMVSELNHALAALPASQDGFKKVVLSGIYEDIPALAGIMEEIGLAVVADDLAKESRAFSRRVPETGDPIEALADGWCALSGDTELFDPQKEHIEKVVSLAEDNGAQGVVILLAKFCDPEEFEAPLATRALKEAGFPVVVIEVDQSTEGYEQARTQLEAFADLIS